ncbi:MAG: hypothetical protein V7607_741 [Solirubrobacteraceae bacterium]
MPILRQKQDALPKDFISRELAATTVRVQPAAPPDRVTLIWRAKWLILAVAVAATAVTYALSSAVAPTYRASAVVRVSVQSDGGISRDVVEGANELASQYAQLVTGDRVLRRAAATLGEQPGGLRPQVSAGTVASQNLIRVDARAGSVDRAMRRANAIAQAFAREQTALNAAQSLAYARSVRRRLAPVDAQIAAARKAAVAAKGTTDTAAVQSTLTSLMTQRQQVESTLAQAAANSEPAVDVYESAGGAAQVQPKPKLYAGLAFIVSLLLAAQLVAAVRLRRPAAREA